MDNGMDIKMFFKTFLEENQQFFSDIILVKKRFFGNVFCNMMTGKKSRKLDYVMRDRKSIVCYERYAQYLECSYVEYDEISGSLLVVALTYSAGNNSFTIRRVLKVTKDLDFYLDGMLFHGGSKDFDPDFFINIYKTDICGETYLLGGIPDIFYTPDYVVPSHMVDAGRKFINGMCSIGEIWKELFIENASDFADVLIKIFMADKKHISFGCMEAGTKGMEIPEIPAEAMEKIKNYYIRPEYFKYNYKLRKFASDILHDNFAGSVSILQRCGSYFVQRHFHVSYVYEKGEIGILPVEYKRVLVAPGFRPGRCVYGPLIWLDKLEGTYLAPYAGILNNEWMEPFTEGDCVFAVTEILNSPAFEKVLNFVKEGWWRRGILNSFLLSNNADEYMETAVRGFDPAGKNPWQVCQVPRHYMMRSISFAEDINFCFGFIALAKNLFWFAPDYLIRMGKESCDSLFERLAEHYYDGVGSIVGTAAVLIKYLGPSNWKNYFDYVSDISHSVFFNEYRDYLRMADTLGDKENFTDWRLRYEDIENRFAALKPLYDDTVRERENKVMDEFKKHIREADKYCYSKEGLFICPPDSAMELTQEGMKLHHCAGSFFNAIARGETMLLFVRKKEAPDKPYYTVELKDNAIRQCHGFDNCPATDDVHAFLESFSEEYGIEYSRMECKKIYGAEGDDVFGE